MKEVKQQVSEIIKYIFSVGMGIWFSILLFIWIGQLW